MSNPLSLLFNIVFHPDKLDGMSGTYKKDPKTMPDQDMVREAANILDASEFDVLAFVAEKSHCALDYNDWMRTGKLPPMMRLWLRDNLHHLRNRLT